MGNTATTPQRPAQDDAPEDKGGFRYFRSTKHALEVVIGDPDPSKGEVANPTAKFVPYFIEEKGKEGKQKYGFLKTRNGSALKKLDGDPDVQEITKQEFEDATVVKYDDGKPPVQISGFRAPY